MQLSVGRDPDTTGDICILICITYFYRLFTPEQWRKKNKDVRPLCPGLQKVFYIDLKHEWNGRVYTIVDVDHALIWRMGRFTNTAFSPIFQSSWFWHFVETKIVLFILILRFERAGEYEVQKDKMHIISWNKQNQNNFPKLGIPPAHGFIRYQYRKPYNVFLPSSNVCQQ